MTDQPRPAPKTQRSIRGDPKVDQYQVVVSWRVPARPVLTVTEYRDAVEKELRRQLGDAVALYVTVYEITAPSEHEGTVGLDVTEDAEYGGSQTDVPTKGRT
jgi:hypothetical protein